MCKHCKKEIEEGHEWVRNHLKDEPVAMCACCKKKFCRLSTFWHRNKRERQRRRIFYKGKETWQDRTPTARTLKRPALNMKWLKDV